MSRTSSISFPAKEPVLVIRQSYLTICDDNACAAALLSVFQYWYEVKIAHQKQASHYNRVASAEGKAANQDVGVWVYKSYTELKDDLLGLYAERSIAAAIELLHGKGFIDIRENPTFKWDRKPQYRFRVVRVQKAIGKIAPSMMQNSAVDDAEMTDAQVKNDVAIPETTPEITNTEEDVTAENQSEKPSRKVNPFFDAVGFYIFNTPPENKDAIRLLHGQIVMWMQYFRTAIDPEKKIEDARLANAVYLFNEDYRQMTDGKMVEKPEKIVKAAAEWLARVKRNPSKTNGSQYVAVPIDTSVAPSPARWGGEE